MLRSSVVRTLSILNANNSYVRTFLPLTRHMSSNGDDAVNTFKSELNNLLEHRKKAKELIEADIPKHSDVLIIGGGAIGLSVAFWLKRRNPEGFTVTVVERDPTYSRAATTLSVGSIRQQFSLPENIQLSLFSAGFLQNIREHLSVLDLDPPNIQFNHQGYLMLASDSAGKSILEQNYEIQSNLGARTELLSQAGLQNKFPWLNVSDLQAGSYGLANEGWFDPWMYLCALKVKCQSLGVHFVKGEVVEFNKALSESTIGVTGQVERRQTINKLQVKTDDGKTYPMEFALTVNCAGPWSGEVAALAGIGTAKDGPLSIPLPVEPRKRFVYVVHCPNGPGLNMPMLVDAAGVYVRREGLSGLYICGASPDPENEPNVNDLEVDYDFFNEKVWPILAHRIPAFEKLKMKSAWAGFYDYNYFDQNLIIGSHPYFRNFMMATGCSGHGIQQSPAIGRAMAEYIIENTYDSIDLSRFSFDRIMDSKPLFEHGPYII